MSLSTSSFPMRLVLSNANTRLNTAAGSGQYFRKSLAFQSPEEWQINQMYPPQAFFAEDKDRRTGGQEARAAQSTRKNRMFSQAPDAEVINMLYPVELFEQEEQRLKKWPQALKRFSPSTYLPVGARIDAPENGDDIVLVERRTQMESVEVPAKNDSRKMDLDWIVQHIIVSTLKPGNNVRHTAYVAQLKFIAAPAMKEMCKILEASDVVLCLALYYIDSLFQDRELVGLQDRFAAFNLAPVIVRIFGLALNLAFKWIEDFPEALSRIQHLLRYPTRWEATNTEVKMLTAFGFNTSIGPVEWAFWLHQLADVCFGDSKAFRQGADASLEAIEDLLFVADGGQVSSPFSPCDYVPKHVDPSKVPAIVQALLSGIESPVKNQYPKRRNISLALFNIGQNSIWTSSIV